MLKKYRVLFSASALALGVALFPYQSHNVEAATTPTSFSYNCSVDGTLAEAGDMSSSWSPYWWVNSGAYMYLSGGVCKTVSGALSPTNLWSKLYNASNPVDTDQGAHPQNIFRLVTKSKWGGTLSQQVYVDATKMNLSASEQRDAWSGILLFNRYQDGQNLYYAGIRDDGHAVIKSKKNGIYTTLAEVPVFPGTYNRTINPTLLPFNKWIGLKTDVKTNADGSVSINLYLDQTGNGTWKLAVSATDKTNPILTAGYAGLRLDYRDALFDNYKISAM